MDDNLELNLDNYLPLRDVVFNALRRAILKGELAPGERLMEKQLADRMGVSRTPIREAIRKLELEGLVVMIARKGAEVARITEKDLRDVLEVRCALEELAVKLACEKMTQKQVARLKATVEVFKEAVNNKEVDKIIDADVEFHDVIFESTGNVKLIQIVNNLREQFYRYRIEYVKKSDAHLELLDEHEAILKAITNKNVELAVSETRKHIINQETTVIKYINENVIE